MKTDKEYLDKLLNGYLKDAEGLDYIARYRVFIAGLLMILTNKSEMPMVFDEKDLESLDPVVYNFVWCHRAKIDCLGNKDPDIVTEMMKVYIKKARKERCKVCNLWNFNCNRVCGSCKNTYYCCVDHQKSD